MGHNKSRFNGVVVGSDSVLTNLTKWQLNDANFDGDEFAVKTKMDFRAGKRNAVDLMSRTADSTANPWKQSNKSGTASSSTRKQNRADNMNL